MIFKEVLKSWLIFVALLLISFCSKMAVAVTITYQFQPDPNALRTSGGFSGQGKGSYSIEGQFELSINLNTAVASFRWVDAALSEKIWFIDYNEGPIFTDSLDVLFHMTELVSTDVNETAIRFELRRNDPIFPGADILVVVTYMNNSVHLVGNFCEAYYDGYCYHLDAFALPLPRTYHDLAIFAEQWLLEGPLYDIAPEPDGDGVVNFLDFAVFAENWLKVD
jgi:hypothetical protein